MTVDPSVVPSLLCKRRSKNVPAGRGIARMFGVDVQRNCQSALLFSGAPSSPPSSSKSVI